MPRTNGGIIGKRNVTSFGKCTVTSKTSSSSITTQSATRVVNVAIVGGGAGGIELALALTQYLKTKQNIKEIKVNLISKGQYLAKAKNKISQNTILRFLKKSEGIIL